MGDRPTRATGDDSSLVINSNSRSGQEFFPLKMIKSVFDRLPKRASPFFKPDLSRYDKSAIHDIESCETDSAAILKYEIAWDISRGFPVDQRLMALTVGRGG